MKRMNIAHQEKTYPLLFRQMPPQNSAAHNRSRTRNAYYPRLSYHKNKKDPFNTLHVVRVRELLPIGGGPRVTGANGKRPKPQVT